MYFKLAICIVLAVGCALLAIPAPPTGHGYPDQQPTVTGDELSRVSLSKTLIAASCTLPGRPCNPKQSTCCAGSKCVFRGGSTRVGYQCVLRAGSANASTDLLWEKLLATNLDPDLTEVALVANSAAE